MTRSEKSCPVSEAAEVTNILDPNPFVKAVQCTQLSGLGRRHLSISSLIFHAEEGHSAKDVRSA